MIVSFGIYFIGVVALSLMLVKKRYIIFIILTVIALFFLHHMITAYSADEEKIEVALTINVYENTDVDSLLLMLSDIKATFFISEEFENLHGDKLIKLADYGHDIGLLENDFENKSIREINDHLAKRIENLAFLSGQNCQCVRFKDNIYSAKSIMAVNDLHLTAVQWSATEADKIYSMGDIILVEDCRLISEAVDTLSYCDYKVVDIESLIKNKLTD